MINLSYLHNSPYRPPAKGSHEKISISQLLLKGAHIGTFADLEDALSLPKWTDAVPFYLRSQILALRAKVAELRKQMAAGGEE